MLVSRGVNQSVVEMTQHETACDVMNNGDVIFMYVRQCIAVISRCYGTLRKQRKQINNWHELANRKEAKQIMLCDNNQNKCSHILDSS